MAEIELRTGATENQMWALNLLGSIARDQNRTGMAIAQFENMVERFPNFPMGHYNLGQIQHTEENYRAASRPPSKAPVLILTREEGHWATATPGVRSTKCEKRKSSSTVTTRTLTEYCWR
jgi:hypothetical protein